MASLVRKHKRAAKIATAKGEKRQARELGKKVFRLFKQWQADAGEKASLAEFLTWLEVRAEDEGWTEKKLETIKNVVTQLVVGKAQQAADEDGTVVVQDSGGSTEDKAAQMDRALASGETMLPLGG